MSSSGSEYNMIELMVTGDDRWRIRGFSCGRSKLSSVLKPLYRREALHSNAVMDIDEG